MEIDAKTGDPHPTTVGYLVGPGRKYHHPMARTVLSKAAAYINAIKKLDPENWVSIIEPRCPDFPTVKSAYDYMESFINRYNLRTGGELTPDAIHTLTRWNGYTKDLLHHWKTLTLEAKGTPQSYRRIPTDWECANYERFTTLMENINELTSRR
jgi:hypothetical protein